MANIKARKTPLTTQFEEAIAAAEAALEEVDDQVVRARLALRMTDIARMAQEVFGEQYTQAFIELREQFGYTLADLGQEFGMSRARAAQIAVRERYKSGESVGGGGRAKHKT